MQVTTASLIGTWWEFPDEEISSVSMGLSVSQSEFVFNNGLRRKAIKLAPTLVVFVLCGAEIV